MPSTEQHKRRRKMKLVEKVNQIRRDFTGVYECEGCGETETKRYCYDDTYFHTRVTPEMKCPKCGESTNSLNEEVQQVVTKYADHEVV